MTVDAQKARDEGSRRLPWLVGGRDRVQVIAALSGAVALYCALAGVGLEMALWHKNAPLVWPSTGFALALVLLRGYRYLSAIALGAFLIEYLLGNGLLYGLAGASAAVASIALSVWVLKAFCRFSNALERITDVMAFIFVGALYVCATCIK